MSIRRRFQKFPVNHTRNAVPFVIYLPSRKASGIISRRSWRMTFFMLVFEVHGWPERMFHMPSRRGRFHGLMNVKRNWQLRAASINVLQAALCRIVCEFRTKFLLCDDTL